MPRVQIDNLSGAAVTVQNGTTVIGHLPAGFNGAINLEGVHTFTQAGTFSVSTNQVETGTTQTTGPSTNGLVQVSVQNNSTGGPVAVYAPSGSATELWPVGESGTMNSGNNYSTQTTLPPTPNYGAALLTVEDGQGTPLVVSWSEVPLVTTNYATSYQTNTITGQTLGSIDAGATTKGVTLHPDGITLHDYGTEVEAFSIGLSLAFTVFLFGFILRLVRAIPNQGGDF